MKTLHSADLQFTVTGFRTGFPTKMQTAVDSSSLTALNYFVHSVYVIGYKTVGRLPYLEGYP
jgi:hypothetical protein